MFWTGSRAETARVCRGAGAPGAQNQPPGGGAGRFENIWGALSAVVFAFSFQCTIEDRPLGGATSIGHGHRLTSPLIQSSLYRYRNELKPVPAVTPAPGAGQAVGCDPNPCCEIRLSVCGFAAVATPWRTANRIRGARGVGREAPISHAAPRRGFATPRPTLPGSISDWSISDCQSRAITD